MKLTEAWMLAFLLLFIRTSACMLVAPFLGNQVPVFVRVLFCGSVSLALTSVVQSTITKMPQHLGELLFMVLGEIAIGILLGLAAQIVIFAAQLAGSLLDVQIGLSGAQVLNPVAGTPVSVLAGFKTMLVIVLLFCINGHHILLSALVESYQVATPGLQLDFVGQGVLGWFGTMSLLGLQIAAAPIAVCFLIDLVAGVINKAIPQMQVYIVTMPLKLLMGFLALAFGLPFLVGLLQMGLEQSFFQLQRMFSR